MTRYYQNIENKSRNRPDAVNRLKLGENKKPPSNRVRLCTNLLIDCYVHFRNFFLKLH